MISYLTAALGTAPILLLALGTIALDVRDATNEWVPVKQEA